MYCIPDSLNQAHIVSCLAFLFWLGWSIQTKIIILYVMKQNTFQQLQRTFGTFNQKRELDVFYFCKCRRHKDVSLTKIKNSALDHIHLIWKGSSFNGNQIHNCFKVKSMWEVWYSLTCIENFIFWKAKSGF